MQQIFKLYSYELFKMQKSLEYAKTKQFRSLTRTISIPVILFAMFLINKLLFIHDSAVLINLSCFNTFSILC